MNSQTRQNLLSSNCFRKIQAPFDTVEAINKFHQGLRDSEVIHRINNNKNPFIAGWITRPTKRIDRQAKMKEVSFLKRSGFNKKIDNPQEFGYIDKPTPRHQIKQHSLRHQTSHNLSKIVKDQQSDFMNDLEVTASGAIQAVGQATLENNENDYLSNTLEQFSSQSPGACSNDF